MAFRRSSLLIRKSFLTYALSNCSLYSSFFQLSSASTLFSIGDQVLILLPVLVFKEIIVAYRRRAEPFHCSFENVLKLTKDDITYFLLENVNKHGFFEILSPQSILLVSSFPRMKSGNCKAFCVLRKRKKSQNYVFRFIFPLTLKCFTYN